VREWAIKSEPARRMCEVARWEGKTHNSLHDIAFPPRPTASPLQSPLGVFNLVKRICNCIHVQLFISNWLAGNFQMGFFLIFSVGAWLCAQFKMTRRGGGFLNKKLTKNAM